MGNYFKIILGLSSIVTGILINSRAQAGSYFEPLQFFHDPSNEGVYEDRYVQFGGCEESLLSCFLPTSFSSDELDAPYVRIDAIDGIKKGIYAVEGPGPDVENGKFAFTYTYSYNTSEDADDVAIVKIKKVANNEIVYYKEYSETSDGPQDVRVLLPIEAAADILQLVFEVDGREEEDSHPIFFVDNVSARVTSAAQVSGTITSAAGLPIEGAKVYLKQRRKDNNKHQAVKSTTTNDEGGYYFHPVRKNRRYNVIVTHNGERYVEKIKGVIKRGQNRVIDIALE